MNDYHEYYSDQVKGIYRAPLVQRGYSQRGRGIGRLLRNFMQWITPLAKKHILPKIEDGAKFLGNKLVDSVSDFAKDTIEGKNVGESARDRYEGLVSAVKTKFENTLEGKGIKRKRNQKNFIILKPNKNSKRARDIFDNL